MIAEKRNLVSILDLLSFPKCGHDCFLQSQSPLGSMCRPFANLLAKLQRL